MFTSAHTMVKLKIQRNRKIINLLEIENKIIKLEMVSRHRLLNHNNAHIQQVNKIINVETEQLLEYKLHREEYVTDLTNEINDTTLDVETLQSEINELKNQFKIITTEIKQINETIPVLTYIINYKIEDSAAERYF